MHELKVPSPNRKWASPLKTAPPTVGRIKSLTGLRFAAALLVFVHHLDGRFGLAGTGLPLANNAVSFFFVLSGFILTLVYGRQFERSHQNAGDGNRSTGDVFLFLKKRIARLWPLHFVCLLICVATTRFPDLSFLPNLANLFLVHSWIPHNLYLFGLNNVSWSISTELFFCFAFPLLVINGYRGCLWRYGLLILGTIGCWCLLDFAMDSQWITRQWAKLTIQANPLIRLFEFATGILTAYLFTRTPQRVDRTVSIDTAFEFGALGLVIVWWTAVLQFNLLATVHDTPMIGRSLGIWIWFCSAAPLFGLVVWIFARSNGLIARFMGSPLMVHLGEISFAFYMIHMIVIRVIAAEADPFIITGTRAIVLSLVASLAAAELLFRFVELPCKDGMVALLNGQPMESFVKSTKAVRQVLFKPLTAIAALALIAVAGFVHQNSLTKHELARVEQIVQESSEAHKQIDFADASKLQGCLLNIDNDTIKIELAWEPTDTHSETRRTIYLMDQNMNPINTDKLVWRRHHRAFAVGKMYDFVEFDRTEVPALHRIMLAWENKDGERAPLSKNGHASSLELLELHCVAPELAATDTLSLPPGKLRSLIEQMPQEKPYLALGNHATLCGYECLTNPDGSLTINLAWRLKPELAERRVLYFMDDDNAVVGYFGDVAVYQFVGQMEGPEEKLFLDQISITPDSCAGASTVALGLWDEQTRQMVQIEKGETINNGKRLIIGRIETANQ